MPSTYEYPRVALTRLLDDAAEDFPHTPAVQFLGHEVTYRQLLDHVDRFATALRDLGVRKGDRVALVLPNCPQHVVAVFAALRLGAVVVPLEPQAGKEGVARRLNDSGAAVVVCLDSVYPRLAALKGRLTAVRHLVATGLQDYLPFPRNVLFPLTGRRDGSYHAIADTEGVKRFIDLVRRTPPTVAQVATDADDLAMLAYGSDRTGRARGIMLTHYNLVANTFQARLWIPDVLAGGENVLCAAPYHGLFGFVAGLALGVLSAATLTMVPRPGEAAMVRAAARRRPTLLVGTPTLYEAIQGTARRSRRDLSSIRVGLSSGGPLAPGTAGSFEARSGAKLREVWGSPEAAGLTHANPVYGRAKAGSMGLPLTDTVCTLVDRDDPARGARGTSGELAVHGPQVMRGYWNRPAETAAVLRDGWLLTGDRATLDRQGYFHRVDAKPVPGVS